MAKYRIVESRFGKFSIQKKVKVVDYSFWLRRKVSKKWTTIDVFGNILYSFYPSSAVLTTYSSLNKAKERLDKIRSKEIIHSV